jgi:hypothetical protein
MSKKAPSKSKGSSQYGYIFGRPRAYATPQEMASEIEKYFEKWEGEKRPLTMAGLQTALGIIDDTFERYAAGKYDDKDYPEGMTFSGTIKAARKYIENSKLEHALNGTYNASVSIFDLKNNHGYSDKSEIKNYDMTPTVVKDDIPDEE